MSSIIYSSKDPSKVIGIELTESEYRLHEEEYNGFCLACGATAYGDTEPDARNYTCDECGEEKVFGIPELLLMSRVRLV